MNVLREEPDVGKPQVQFCEECGAVTLPFTRPDIVQVIIAFNTIAGDEEYKEDLDFNQDGAINIKDIVIIVKHFNSSSSSY
ncbi:MAG: hypothetical protein GX383_10180 [Clostridium sp.]|nr:hypothetical protein [Clostridium sp.]